jgi:hypothetical protein
MTGITSARAAVICVIAGAVCAGACADSEVQPSNPRIRGTVADRAGDSVLAGAVPLPPDLISGTIEVSGDTLVVTVTFAAGTLSSMQTLVRVTLDTDENDRTGVADAQGDPAMTGVDYMLDIVPAVGGAAAQGRLLRLSPAARTLIVPLTFPSGDQLQMTVPLSELGGDDGKLRFKVSCSHYFPTLGNATGPLDYMPDFGAAAGIVE